MSYPSVQAVDYISVTDQRYPDASFTQNAVLVSASSRFLIEAARTRGKLTAQRKHAVTVVATGDESPMMRRLAPKTAMCIAEYFRDRGEKVLLIIDSVTRFAHAARDVALAAGEPPVSRGYTPSVR